MPLESYTDVLIIGAGPAGLMCANALAMAGIEVRIIDKRPVKITAGHADGIQPRTIEVLQSYGLAERLVREGSQIYMYAFYDPGHDGGTEFTRRVPCIPLSINVRYPFVVGLHQGAIEAIFHDSMKNYEVEVERSKQPVDIEISEDVDELSSTSSYPVKVTIECLDAPEERKMENIHARFVVGADGAHSWVRKTLRIEMEGEQTDHAWGVIDMITQTNFPDIRHAAAVRSKNGSCLIIPREGELNRFYCQLSDTDVMDPSTGKVDKSKMTPEDLISVIRKILHPFELADPSEVRWWATYIIGQRVASSYSVKDRVFIAGDACHTHSPKAGQGMNASMNDTHNLAWKLAQVIRGWSKLSILETYEQERRTFAQELINFDKNYANLFSTKPKTMENKSGVSQDQFLLGFQIPASKGMLSGTGVHYSPSVITDPMHQGCASNLIVGQRVPSQIFLCAADIRPIDIQDLLPSDVRFKVLFFVGNLTVARMVELNFLAKELSNPSSFLRKYSPDGDISTVFDIITIISGKKEDIDCLLIPAFFRSHWSKVLLDDADVRGDKGGDGYESFGVDPDQTTLVVVRPDGYVGMIAPSMSIVDLDNYFEAFLLPRDLIP